jgi:hypothetical protein
MLYVPEYANVIWLLLTMLTPLLFGSVVFSVIG